MRRKLASMLTFWSQGGQQATYVTAVIMGTYLVFAGECTVGSIIAVGILTGRTLAPLTQLAGTMARWGNVKSALDGLESIAGAQQDAEEHPGQGEIDAAAFYCPYVPLMSSGVVVDPATFEPVVSFMTRYGYVELTNTASSLGNAADYLSKIAVSNLAFV